MKRWLGAGALVLALLVIVVMQSERRAPTPPMADGTPATGSANGDEARWSQPGTAVRNGDDMPVSEICDPAADPGFFEMADPELYAWELNNWAITALAVSTDAEHQLVAALLAWPDDRPRTLQLLLRARELDRSRPLIAMQVLHVCGLQREQCGVPLATLENELLAADRANGFAWMQVAQSRLKRADAGGALAAIREAIAAPDFDGRFVELQGAIERGLAASLDLASAERLEIALGLVVTKWLTAAPMFSECLAQSGQSAEWAAACISLGERLEVDSRTVINKSLGLQLQGKLYERLGDSRALAAVDARQDSLQERFKKLSAGISGKGLKPTESQLRSYIDAFAAGDELSALERLKSDFEAVASATAARPTCSDSR